MKKIKKTYDRAFKENAVKLSLERKNQSSLARELGIDPSILRRWRREYEQYKENSWQGKGNAPLSEIEREILRLKKELQRAKLEAEILKKAIAFISKNDC